MAKDKTIRWDVCEKCKDALAEEYLKAEAAKEESQAEHDAFVVT